MTVENQAVKEKYVKSSNAKHRIEFDNIQINDNDIDEKMNENKIDGKKHKLPIRQVNNNATMGGPQNLRSRSTGS